MERIQLKGAGQWKYFREADRRKIMKGIREEEKAQETLCTGLLGIFLSLFIFFFNSLFYFVLIVQCKQFKCQKLKPKPGP